MAASTFIKLLYTYMLFRTSVVSAISLRGASDAGAAGGGSSGFLTGDQLDVDTSADVSASGEAAALANASWADEEVEYNAGGQLGIDPCGTRPLLFVAVPSAPDNTERRTAVRNTWMQYKVIAEMNCVEAKFFVGVDDLDRNDESLLNDEKEKYGDLVKLHMKDAYELLPNKTLTILEWVEANSHASWFMKLDDDAFPHLEGLVRYLQGLGNVRYGYGGAFLWKHPVLHKDKWAEKESFKQDFYPPYAVGAGYLLSRKLVKRFVRDVYYNSTDRNNLLKNEDSEVGVWVDRMPDKKKVILKDMNASMWGCREGDLISMQLPIHEMKCMWHYKSGIYARADDNLCCDWKETSAFFGK